MLTREETARVYMNYMFCTAIHEKSNTVFEITGITWMFNEYHLLTSPNCNTAYAISECKILGHELSAITDEHAVEVAKMVHPDYIHFHKVKDGKDIVSSWAFEYPVADKLRSWGYMLPYNGVDLFKAGIAIIKQ